MQIRYHQHAVERMMERNVSTKEIELILENPDGKILQSRDKAIFYKKLKGRKDNLVAAVVVEFFDDDRIEIITVLVNFEVKK